MKMFAKNTIKFWGMLTMLLPFAVFSQSLEVELAGTKNCTDDSYCVAVSMRSAPGSGDQELGTSSLFLTYDRAALSFRDYTAAHFHDSEVCNASNSWAAHQYDAVSRTGVFNLTLMLLDEANSCPTVTEVTPVEVGTICFDILQQGGVPEVTVDDVRSTFHPDSPNDGTVLIPLSSVDTLNTANLLACDCPGEGSPCDDQNPYTTDDKFDLNCQCAGTFADADEDGIYDGIDPCLDLMYEAEEALFTSGLQVRNSNANHWGDGYLDLPGATGDWIEFTVEPQNSGDHALAVRYASGSSSDRSIELVIDGVVEIADWVFSNTGGWDQWDTLQHVHNFTAGTHTVRLNVIENWGPDIDRLELSYCTGCLTAGQTCDDGDACTTDDVYDADCNCGGIYLDTDGDGVCNPSDICEGFDDGVDTDGDGTPDGCDDCDDNLIGTACDDGDPCTENDVYDSECNCAGTFAGGDDDMDGVCNAEDICPGFDDNIDTDGDGTPDGCDACNNLLEGAPCNDGDTCTILDVYDATCGCAGLYLDTDGDGVCNMLDICEGHDDSIDTDGDGIPDGCDDCDNFTVGNPCDDGDICTINDTLDQDCNCVGILEDTDGDSICDFYDQCPGENDLIDSDGDMVPDGCESCWDFVYEAEDAYYSGPVFKNWTYYHSGTGFLDYKNSSGDTVTFTIEAPLSGDYTVALRYAAWSNSRYLDVYVDGVLEIADLYFPNTLQWHKYERVEFMKTLTAGTHTITLTTNGSHGPNLDYLSICTAGYPAGPEIAEGNNEFEEGLDHWTRLHNYVTGTTEIALQTDTVVCGLNSLKYSGGAMEAEQAYADIRYLTIGQNYTLHFYAYGTETEVYVGPLSNPSDGVSKYVNVTAADDFEHQTLTFTATASTMRLMADYLPDNYYGSGGTFPIALDAFSFDNTNCRLKVSPKIFLKGPFVANDTLMADDLRAADLIPQVEPYSDLNAFTHQGRGGNETVDGSVLSVTGDSAIVDWVFLELRNKNDDTHVLATRSALLQRNGLIVDVDGVSPVGFPVLYDDDYYLVVRHRNHMGIMHSALLSLSQTATYIDMTSPLNTAWGTGARTELIPDIWGLWSGDLDQSGAVDASDRSAAWNGRNSTGYREDDANLNGSTDAADRSTTWNNRNRTEQIPE